MRSDFIHPQFLDKLNELPRPEHRDGRNMGGTLAEFGSHCLKPSYHPFRSPIHSILTIPYSVSRIPTSTDGTIPVLSFSLAAPFSSSSLSERGNFFAKATHFARSLPRIRGQYPLLASKTGKKGGVNFLSDTILVRRQAAFSDHGIQRFTESLDCLINVFPRVSRGHDEASAAHIGYPTLKQMK